MVEAPPTESWRLVGSAAVAAALLAAFVIDWEPRAARMARLVAGVSELPSSSSSAGLRAAAWWVDATWSTLTTLLTSPYPRRGESAEDLHLSQ